MNMKIAGIEAGAIGQLLDRIGQTHKEIVDGM